MTNERWPRCLRAGVVKVDEADRDEQERQQEDDNAHARQCITKPSTDSADYFPDFSVESVKSVIKTPNE